MQKRILIAALGLALAGTALAAEQFIPVPSYRVGPYPPAAPSTTAA